MRMRAATLTALSIAIAIGEPPSEFRIFASGANETVKGTFVFDEAAAASVMAEYAAHGIDLPLDYDHAMLGGGAADPALSGKAAGWFALELRNGELWAVNVRWTEPAAEALRRKEWRFMSPAFQADKAGRVLSLVNVAITNLPATRRLQPLMAASVTALGATGMDAETVKKALAAIKEGNAEACAAILEEMIASAAGGGEAPAADPAPVENSDAPPPDPAKEEDKAAVAASVSRLTRITGKTSIGDAVEEVEIWRASHLKLEAETQNLAKERAALELSARKENAKTLIALGAETPHTSGLSTGTLAKRLVDEPLKEQTARVAALLAARGGKLPSAPVPPAGNSGPAADGSQTIALATGRVVTLSAREIAMCVEMKLDPKEYAARKPVKKD